MSNEYKDWCRDTVQDYLLNKVLTIEEIEYMTEYSHGYLIIGRHIDNSRGAYFVWNDEDCRWSYKSIYV